MKDFKADKHWHQRTPKLRSLGRLILGFVYVPKRDDKSSKPLKKTEDPVTGARTWESF